MESSIKLAKNILNPIKSESIFKEIKSKNILHKVFYILNNKKLLEIVKYDKKIMKRLNINLDNYKEYCEAFSSIEIELIPINNNKYSKFINIKKEDESYYHVYFDNNEQEIKRFCLNENEKVSKIKIIIDYQINSFEELFFDCECIESIYFKKFFRNNINNMMLMFFSCSSLKEINLSNFNTINVTNMKGMFLLCSSLKKINLSNLNTCNVTDMSLMFYKCSSLKEINLSNFNISNVTDINGMFDECTDEIKSIVKSQINNIKEEAFEHIEDVVEYLLK